MKTKGADRSRAFGIFRFAITNTGRQARIDSDEE
jgi:hypothetical protein